MTDTHEKPVFDMNEWRGKPAPKVDDTKGGRKKRMKKLADSAPKTDGRSLRATGRTEHLVLKAHPTIVKALDKHVGRGKKSLWIEQAILAKLEAEGYDLDG
jgi:hypothetical protein